ncbi:MAG: hypothetical protein J1E34_06835 [Oscillospiraceae bacterium]|nr:hypothetical protein [Oscillospiraceae bacterium]
MKDIKNYKLQPAVFGVFICIFLQISRYLGSSDASQRLLSLNTVLIIVILFLTLHLVRRTSELFQQHVWNSPWTFVLLLMPLINLIVTGVQLIADASEFFKGVWVNAVLIFVSMPVFMCVYFAYISFKLPKNKAVRIISILMFGLGVIYVFFRLYSVAVYPSDKVLSETVSAIFSHYSEISLVINLLSVACFIVSAKPLQEETHYI